MNGSRAERRRENRRAAMRLAAFGAASGSLASAEKLMMWKCGKCGYNNHAPADQSPHNVVMCYQCEELLEWHQVLKMQTPENEKGQA